MIQYPSLKNCGLCVFVITDLHADGCGTPVLQLPCLCTIGLTGILDHVHPVSTFSCDEMYIVSCDIPEVRFAFSLFEDGGILVSDGVGRVWC